jgi:hypothetical protein
MKQSIFFLLISITLFACSKQEQRLSLTGKWKLTEQKNDYVNGGNFQWSVVPYEHSYEFRADGSFTEQQPPNTNLGNYVLQNVNGVMLLSGISADALPFERLDKSTFLLRYQVREGEVLQKFVLVR